MELSKTHLNTSSQHATPHPSNKRICGYNATVCANCSFISRNFLCVASTARRGAVARDSPTMAPRCAANARRLPPLSHIFRVPAPILLALLEGTEAADSRQNRHCPVTSSFRKYATLLAD
ncbi:hypothetical protein EVAR_39973_1 [Eumeta japonica]|uniref:Uncharacterized protein n=1 Tax=Eumeta variegata TaxID=151549 RepID=A0A4C1X2E7_EUMVA|nr:hypothetical protein EVAR_39973_1 [Eumeta japonica]